MKSKKITTFIILALAIGVASYVIYSEWQASKIAASHQKKLEEYLEEDPLLDGDSSLEEETEPSGARVGAMSADLSLPTKDLTEMKNISDYRGEFLVMNLWASWCPPCQDEMPHIIQFHEDYQDENVQVIGVNLTTLESSAESMEQFIEDFQIPFPILLDIYGEVYQAYEAINIPMTFILDPDGRIAARQVGYLNYDILENLYKEAKKTWEEDL